MKSMSISAHGSSTLACVCRCSSGVRRASSPAIHIFAGEKVCIQAMTPIVSSAALASWQIRRIAAELVSTGFHTTVAPSRPLSSSARATSRDCEATCSRVSGPYSPWLPVRNQISDIVCLSRSCPANKKQLQRCP
jgi:hypothetical protein